MSWERVCAVGELLPGEVLRLEVDPPIAVYNVDGEFYATADTCSHAESSLSEGYLEEDTIECVWHFARFCVRNGKALSLPATTDLRSYSVRVEDGDVLVER